MTLSELLRKPRFLAEDPDKQEEVIDTYVEAARQQALSNNGLGGDPRKYFQAVAEADQAKVQLGLTKDTRSWFDKATDSFVEGLDTAADSMTALQAVSGILPPDKAAEQIAANALERSQRPQARSMMKFQKAGDKGWAAPLINLFSNPEAAALITAQGLGTSVPGITTGAVAAGAAGLLKAGPIVRALSVSGAVGGSSALVEGGAQILEDLQAEAGGDLQNTEALTQALSNPEVLAKLRDRATKRGIGVGAFDAASVLVPSERILKTARGLKGLAQRGLINSAIQGGLGGAGEVAGNVAIGEETNPSDFWAEVVGEVLPGMVELGIAGRGDLTPQTDQALREKLGQNQARVFATPTVDAAPVLRKKRPGDFSPPAVSAAKAQEVVSSAAAAPQAATTETPLVAGQPATPVTQEVKPVKKPPTELGKTADEIEKELPEEERKSPFIIHSSGVGTSSEVNTLAKKYNLTVQPTLNTQDTEAMVAGDLERADAVLVIGNDESLRNDPGQMQQRRAAIKKPGTKGTVIEGRDPSRILLNVLDFLRANPKAKNFAVAMPQSTAINVTGEQKQKTISTAGLIVDQIFDFISQLDPDPAKRDYDDLERQIREYSGLNKAELADPKQTAANVIPGYPYASNSEAARELAGEFEGPGNENNILVYQTGSKPSAGIGALAKTLGAQPGQIGLAGRTYALPFFTKQKQPSKKKLSREGEESGLDIKKTQDELKKFLEFAKANPSKRFFFMPSAYTGNFTQLEERQLWGGLTNIPSNVRPMADTYSNALARGTIASQNAGRVVSWDTQRAGKRGRNSAQILNLDKVEESQNRPLAPQPGMDPEQAKREQTLADVSARLTRAQRIRGIGARVGEQKGSIPILKGVVISEDHYKRYLRPAATQVKRKQERRAIGTPEEQGTPYRPKQDAGGITEAFPFPFRVFGRSKTAGGDMVLLVRNIRRIGDEVSTEEAEQVAQYRKGSLDYLKGMGSKPRYLVEFRYLHQVPQENISRSIPPKYTFRRTEATNRSEALNAGDLDAPIQTMEEISEGQEETQVTFGAQGGKENTGYFRPPPYLKLKFDAQAKPYVEFLQEPATAGEPARKPVAMSYPMPPEAVRAELRVKYPKGTTTLKLVQNGDRKATTRRPFAKVGDEIRFEDDPTVYEVTEVRAPNLTTPEGRREWEESEGWSLDFIDRSPKLRQQVYSPDAVQTVFRKVTRRGGIAIPYVDFDQMVSDILEENELPVSALIEREVPLFRRMTADELGQVRLGLKLAREVVGSLKPGDRLNRKQAKMLRPFLDLVGRHVELQNIVREAYQGSVEGWGLNTPRNYVKLMAARLIGNPNLTTLVPSGNSVPVEITEAAEPDPVKRSQNGGEPENLVPDKAVFTSDDKLVLLDGNNETLQTLDFSFRHKDIANTTRTNVVSQEALVTPGLSIVRADLEAEGKWRNLSPEEQTDLSWIEQGPKAGYRFKFLEDIRKTLSEGYPVGIADADSIAFVKAYKSIFQYEETPDGLIVSGVSINGKSHSVDLPVPGVAGDFSRIFYRILKPFFQVQEDEFNRGVEFGRSPKTQELMRDKPTETFDYRNRPETTYQTTEDSYSGSEPVGSTVPATTASGQPTLSVFSELERSEEQLENQTPETELGNFEQDEKERISQSLRSLRQHLLVKPEIAAAIRRADPDSRYVKMLVLPQVMYLARGKTEPSPNLDYPSGSALITGIVDPVNGEQLGMMGQTIGRSPEEISQEDETGNLIRQAFAGRQEAGRFVKFSDEVDSGRILRAWNAVLRALSADSKSPFVLEETSSDVEGQILNALERVTSYDIFDGRIHFTGVYDQANNRWIGQLPYGARRFTPEEIGAMPRDQVVANAKLINEWLRERGAEVDTIGVDDPNLADTELKSKLQLLQVVAKSYLEGMFPDFRANEKSFVPALQTLEEQKSDLLLNYTTTEGFQSRLNDALDPVEQQALPVLLDHAVRVFDTGIVYKYGRKKAGIYKSVSGRPRERAIIHFRQNTSISEQDAHNLIDRLTITSEGSFKEPGQEVGGARLFRRIFLDAVLKTREKSITGKIADNINALLETYAVALDNNDQDLFSEPAKPHSLLYGTVMRLVENSFQLQDKKTNVRFLGLIDRIKRIHGSMKLPAAPISITVTTSDAGSMDLSDLSMQEQAMLYMGEDLQSVEEVERALSEGLFEDTTMVDSFMEDSEKVKYRRRADQFIREMSEERNALPFVQRMIHDVVMRTKFGIKATQYDSANTRSNSHLDYVFSKVRSEAANNFLNGAELKKAIDLINDFPATYSDPKVLAAFAEQRYEAILQKLDKFVYEGDSAARSAVQLLEGFKQDEKTNQAYVAGLKREAARLDLGVAEKRDKTRKKEQGVQETERKRMRLADLEKQFAGAVALRARDAKRFEESIAETLKGARTSTLRMIAESALDDMQKFSNVPTNLHGKIYDEIFSPLTRTQEPAAEGLEQSEERQRLYEVITRALMPFYSTFPISGRGYRTKINYSFDAANERAIFSIAEDISLRQEPESTDFEPLLDALRRINQPYKDTARTRQAGQVLQERLAEVRAFNVQYQDRAGYTVDNRLLNLTGKQKEAFDRLRHQATEKGLNGVHFAFGTNSRHPVYTKFNTGMATPTRMDSTIFVNPNLLAEKMALDVFDVAYQPTEVVDAQIGEITYRMDLNREVGAAARRRYSDLADQLAANYLSHEVAHLAYMNQTRRDYAALWNGNPPEDGFARYYRERTDEFAAFLKDPENGLKIKQPGRAPITVVEAVGNLYELYGGSGAINNDTLVAEFLRMMMEIEKSGGTIITEITEETRREMSGVTGITRFIEFMRSVLDSLYSLFQGLRNSRDPRAAELYVTYNKVSSLYDKYFSAFMESNLPDGTPLIEPGSRIVPVFGAGYVRPKTRSEAIDSRLVGSLGLDPEEAQTYNTRGLDTTIAKLRETGVADIIDELASDLTPLELTQLLSSDDNLNPDEEKPADLRGRNIGNLTELDRYAVITLAITKLKNMGQVHKAREIARAVSTKIRGMGQTISIIGRLAKTLFYEDPAYILTEYSGRIAEGRKLIGERVKPQMDELMGAVKSIQAAAIGSVLGEQGVKTLINTINRLYGQELLRVGANNIEAILRDHYTNFNGESLLAVLSRILPNRSLDDRTLESLTEQVEENMRIQMANRMGFGGRTVGGKILGRADNVNVDLKEERIQQILEKMVRVAKPPMIKSGSSIENAIAGDAKMILELAIKGALDRDEVLGVIQSIGKFPSFNLETAQVLRELAEEAKSLPPDSFMRGRVLQKALGVLQNATQPTSSLIGGLASAYWYMSLLSGPATFMVNFVSTAFKAIMDMTSYAFAAGVARRDLGLSMRLLGLSFKTFLRSINTIALAEAKGILLKGDLNPRTAGKYITEETINALESMDTDALWKKTLSLGKYVFRVMSASDALFGRAAMESYAHVQAHLKAIEQVEQGLTPYTVEQEAARLIAQTEVEQADYVRKAGEEGLEPGSADFLKRVYELRDQALRMDPERSAIIRRAEELSLYATYNNEPYGVLGFIGKQIGQFNRKYPLGVTIVPFTKIVSNVTNESMNYTPIIGPWRAFKELKESGFKLNERAPGFPTTQAELERISKIERGYQLGMQSILGTALMGMIGVAAAQALRSKEDGEDDELGFNVTGAGPKDPAQLRQAREGGWTNYSFSLGGNTNFRVNYLATPLAIPFAVIGAWSDSARFPRGDDEKSMYETLTSAGLAVIQVPFNQSFLQGLSSLFSIVDGRFEGEDQKALEKLVSSSFGNLVPNIARQIEQVFAPVTPTQTSTMGRLLYNKIPLLRQATGQPTLNVLGEPVNAPNGAERIFFLQRFVNSVKADPLFKLLMEKNIFIPDVKAGTKVGALPLDDAQRYRFREIRGQMLARTMRTERFYQFAQRATQAQLEKYVEDLAGQATRAAKRQMASELIDSGINPFDGSLLTK